MNTAKTGIMIACLAAAAAGAAAAEGSFEPRLEGVLIDRSLQARHKVDCGAEVPCVRLWSEMQAEERAKLWPYLDEVSRASCWNGMSRAERQALKQRLTERDLEQLRRRFTLPKDAREMEHRAHARTEAERSLMRRQILEVHMELSHSQASDVRKNGGASEEP